MPRPRKEQRCTAVSPSGIFSCQRKQGHAGKHSDGKIRWSG